MVVTNELGREYLALASGVVGGLMAWIAVVISNSLSHRRERKKIMSERVYQPLLYQAGLIAEEIRDGRMPDLTCLERIRQDSLFRYRENEVQSATVMIFGYARMYRDWYTAARDNVKRIVREEIEILASGREEDLRKWRSGGYEVRYRAFLGYEPIATTDLESCLLVGRTPVQFLSERHNMLTGLPSAKIDANISGQSVERKFADALSESSLKKADSDQAVQITRQLAKMLSEERDQLAEVLKRLVC